MKTQTRHFAPLAGELDRLAELLELEHKQYRRLLRLAWRQNSYMKRQDVDRLEANSREWSLYLGQAEQVRGAREKYLVHLKESLGLDVPVGNITAFLIHGNPALQFRIRKCLGGIKLTASKLARQNELNRSLAEFCLDLAREENEIFKRCVLDDPAGCYGDDARKTDRGPGGVLVRQA